MGFSGPSGDWIVRFDCPGVPLKQKHEAFFTLHAIMMLCFDVGERRRKRVSPNERKKKEKRGQR